MNTQNCHAQNKTGCVEHSLELDQQRALMTDHWIKDENITVTQDFFQKS